MKKVTRQQARSGQQWTGADRMRLELMAQRQIPADQIAKKLRRSEAAVRAEARKRHVLLAPSDRQRPLTSKQPYGGLRVRPRAVARSTTPSAGRERSHASEPARQELQTESLF